jgi:DNA-binding CsgD family transcriptional regulator
MFMENDHMKSAKICFLDNKDNFLKKYTFRLKRAGYDNVNYCCHAGPANSTLLLNNCNLCIVNPSFFTDTGECLSWISFSRFQDYRGQIVLAADGLSCEDIFGAVSVGVNDIWITGPSLNIEAEVEGILSQLPQTQPRQMNTNRILSMGLFRSTGLTKKEIQLLHVWANGFPRQCEVAARMDISNAYVNKIFSRIYEKLNDTLFIDNPARLAHLITISSMS